MHERHLVKSLTLDEEKARSSLTEIPIIQPPLEIIKDCHIHEDKWYMLMLLGLWPETAASQRFPLESATSQLLCSPCPGIYRPVCLILALVRRVGASVAGIVKLYCSVGYTSS